ncbi:ligase-associated DNA damage response endonuclease PdeM [Synechococcus sp. W4D4]|uniref:ligase-associated DNA damage response endonuclease PdeM n=1 Tax=Synechococcus sp. W4D4 TaxID=3392294 RepID=UPI0039EA4250
MSQHETLIWGDSRLELLPQRAAWDPERRALLIADLHLGKAESFQVQGIPLPSDGDQGNLNRLLELSSTLGALQVLVLGDLIHSRLGLTSELQQKLSALPELMGCELVLVGGNHDRGAVFPSLRAQPSFQLGSWWLSHEPERPPAEGLLNICGHLHPVALLGQGSDRMRLPCFGLDQINHRLLLPAFGDLTGGHPAPAGLERWVIAEDQVLKLPA